LDSLFTEAREADRYLDQLINYSDGKRSIVFSPSIRLWITELSDHRAFADDLSCFRRAIIVFSPMTYRAFADKETR
jgi:hypothetical protein